MAKWSKGGWLFTAGLVCGAIWLGVYRLVTGHLPENWSYGVWGLIAGSILADAEDYLKTTVENTREIAGKIKHLHNQVEKAQEKLETLNWKMDAFKTEFDEFA